MATGKMTPLVLSVSQTNSGAKIALELLSSDQGFIGLLKYNFWTRPGMIEDDAYQFPSLIAEFIQFLFMSWRM